MGEWFTVVGLALAAAGCSGISTTSDWDETYDFSSLATYAWMDQGLEGGVSVDAATAAHVDRRVDAALVVGLDGDGHPVGPRPIDVRRQRDDALITQGPVRVDESKRNDLLLAQEHVGRHIRDHQEIYVRIRVAGVSELVEVAGLRRSLAAAVPDPLRRDLPGLPALRGGGGVKSYLADLSRMADVEALAALMVRLSTFVADAGADIATTNDEFDAQFNIDLLQNATDPDGDPVTDDDPHSEPLDQVFINEEWPLKSIESSMTIGRLSSRV